MMYTIHFLEEIKCALFSWRLLRALHQLTWITHIPMSTVIPTTKALPNRRTKSPTELMAKTLSALLDKILNALRPAVQNEKPNRAAIKIIFIQFNRLNWSRYCHLQPSKSYNFFLQRNYQITQACNSRLSIHKGRP